MATTLVSPPPAQSFMSDEELFAKYGKFCGYMAWHFVKRSGSFDEGERNVRLDTEDAEDLASTAIYYLLRIPQRYRDQPPYVKRVIISKLITAWHKRLKYGRKEYQPPHHVGSHGKASRFHQFTQIDYFDSLPGPDGLAENTQVLFDSQTILGLLPKLSNAERLVIELYFGLNGAKSCGVQRIATKLARTRWWVDARLTSGLSELRKHSGVKEPAVVSFRAVL